MRKRVEFYIEQPENVSDYDFREWLLFKLGANGSMSTKNKMGDIDLEAKNVIILY